MATRGDDELSRTAARVVGLLTPYTPFATAIVRRQSERIGRSLATLRQEDLPKLAPLVVAAASVFVDPGELSALRGALGLDSR
jgi:hypothetical protein